MQYTQNYKAESTVFSEFIEKNGYTTSTVYGSKTQGLFNFIRSAYTLMIIDNFALREPLNAWQ